MTVTIPATATPGSYKIGAIGSSGRFAAATYAAKVPNRRRTLVFSLPTGHYASGAVRDPVDAMVRLCRLVEQCGHSVNVRVACHTQAMPGFRPA